MMQQTGKATPRPWGYGYHRGLDQHLVGVTLENIAIIEDRHENAAENAALIVKAVNAHAALVAALRVCEQDLSDIAGAADNGEPYSLDEMRAFKGTAMAHAALAKAEGA